MRSAGGGMGYYWPKEVDEWFDGFEKEIREILELAEFQIKVLKADLKLHKKPKRKPSEYERIECSISRWQHTRLLCLEILGENQNEG